MLPTVQEYFPTRTDESSPSPFNEATNTTSEHTNAAINESSEDLIVISHEEISDQSQANTSVSSLNLSQHEIQVFLNAKKSATIDYIKYFLTCTVSLYKTITDTDNTAIANACFEG